MDEAEPAPRHAFTEFNEMYIMAESRQQIAPSSE